MQVTCPGCGRQLEQAEGATSLCAKCLWLLSPQPREGDPGIWRASIAVAASVALAVAGVATSVMYGLFTSRLAFGLMMAAAVLAAAAVPLALFLTGRRNAHLTQGALFLLLGGWLLAWSFFPAVDTAIGRPLRLVGMAVGAGGAVLLLVFAAALRRYPRV